MRLHAPESVRSARPRQDGARAACTREQLAESNPVLRLWHACDLVELLLRFSVAVGLGALRSHDRTLPAALRRTLRDMLMRPTLHQWRRAAQIVLDAGEEGGTPLVPELGVLLHGKMADLLDGDSPATPERSFVALRNRLAHGGGITHTAATRLVASWEPRVDDLFCSEPFWSELTMVVRRGEESWVVLRGPDSVSEETQLGQSVLAALAGLHVGKPALVRGEHALPLWPIVLHGVPRPAEDTIAPTRATTQVYWRRGDVEPHYTPIGSNEVTQSHGDEETARELDRLMEVSNEDKLSVQSFDQQIRADAANLVGRRDERARLATIISSAPGGVHWVSGPAGAGKSLVVAGAIADAWDSAPLRTTILAFRFRAGDPRCGRSVFLRFANERLVRELPNVRRPGGSPLDELRHRIQHLTETRLVFVLDGLDELAEQDPTFAAEVPCALEVEGVTWLCAGRAERGLAQAFDGASLPFAGGTLPPMSDADVRSMILERLGRARARLIANDHEVGGSVTNAFVDAVTERAAGAPIYVHHVISDLIARRLSPEPERLLELPGSLLVYHERIVARVGVGSMALVATPIIMTLAHAREPLSVAQIEGVLADGWELLGGECDPNLLVRRALGALDSVLRRHGVDWPPTYGLFHHSFREYLRTAPTTAGAYRTAGMRLARLAQRPPSESPALERYFLRWSVQHMLEQVDAQGGADLHALLAGGRHVIQWARVQDAELVLDDLLLAHAALVPSSPVPQALVAWLATDRLGDGGMPPERVHAWLVYRGDLRLYEAFLELAQESEVWVAEGVPAEDAVDLSICYLPVCRLMGPPDGLNLQAHGTTRFS